MADGFIVFGFLILCIIGFLIISGIFGIIALVRVNTLRKELNDLRLRHQALYERVWQLLEHTGLQQTTPTFKSPVQETRPSQPVATPANQTRQTPAPSRPAPAQPSPVMASSAPPKAQPQVPPRPVTPQVSSSGESWELTLGTRWLNWVGIVFVMIAVAFFLKYAYDNNWVGPLGRLGFGTALGVFSLVLGEKMRRNEYPILFHTLSGGAIGIFYVCIYFAFQVYTLLPAAVAFYLSIFVTALSVGLGVAHNTRILCIIAQLGGFLSPVLLSTGENHPIALFTYVIILNLTAMGSAFFKQWRDVNVVAFVGTMLLYGGWLVGAYDESQLGIALTFATIFYIMFIVIPLLHSLYHKQAATAESLRLVVVAIIAGFLNYCLLLAADYRDYLGYVIFGQGLIQLLLYGVWINRCGEDKKTSSSLLVAAIAIITAAIPIHFSLDHLPIAWITQAVILAYIGTRFEEKIMHLFSILVFVLSSLALLTQLPLHRELFIPIFNQPFATWIVVIAGGLVASSIQYKQFKQSRSSWRILPQFTLIFSLVLFCALLHMETSLFWELRIDTWGLEIAKAWKWTSLSVLWALIAIGFTESGYRLKLSACISAAHIALLITSLMIFRGVLTHTAPEVPLFNLHCLGMMMIVPAAWLMTWRMENFSFSDQQKQSRTFIQYLMEILGHLAFVILFSIDFIRYFPEESSNLLALVLLWSVFVYVFTEIIHLTQRPRNVYILLQSFALVTGSFFLMLYLQLSINPTVPILNYRFGSALVFLVSLGYGIFRLGPSNKDEKLLCRFWEIIGYAFFVIIVYADISDWASTLTVISPLHKHGIISALWSIEAFGLIYFGLRTDQVYRRMIGFLLFGITIFKIFIVDMSVVQPVYRIVSFFMCGIFLIIAGYLYQRYAKLLTNNNNEQNQSVPGSVEDHTG